MARGGMLQSSEPDVASEGGSEELTGVNKNIFTEAATCKMPSSTPLVRYDTC